MLSQPLQGYGCNVRSGTRACPPMATDDRRAETCSSAATLTGSNREGLNCVSLTKHQRRRAVYMFWTSLGRDHPDLVCVKRGMDTLIGSAAAHNMGKSSRQAATTLKDIRR